jgi:hypothetical protein
LKDQYGTLSKIIQDKVLIAFEIDLKIAIYGIHGV